MKHMTLLLALLLACISSARAEDAPAVDKEAFNKRVAALLGELDDADFEKREAATQALIKIGEPAHEAVKKTLADPPSMEVKERAARVERQISLEVREKTTKGGEPAGGLQATLFSSGDTFRAGEKIVFKVQLKNVSETTREDMPIETFDREVPGEFSSTNLSQARIIIRQTSGDRKRITNIASTSMQINRGIQVIHTEIKAGERAAVDVPITNEKPLPIGDYEVTVVYHARTRGMLKEATEDVKSNTVKFKVE